MFTGVGKLKISLPECGSEWKGKSTFICVLVFLLLNDFFFNFPKTASHTSLSPTCSLNRKEMA